ncbi:MAG: sigma-70 family RNA polymerase sigma factor [Anaerolineae bacterium]|nr:sigma-70 family RNA polymerase sigma factor [Anaerolineae bacterium]
MDEVGLIQDAQNGDISAFNRLVLEYQTVAYNVAYRLMGDPFMAEDITQDAFISAYRNLRSFRGGSFKAWLLRIVTNAGYDELRRQKRRPTTALEPTNPESQEEIETPNWLVDPNESPEDTTLRAELANAIQDCLNNLDAEFRLVVILVDIQGMDYREAADSMQKPLGTVKSRLARARGRMQDCLRGFGELLPQSFRYEDERIAQ